MRRAAGAGAAEPAQYAGGRVEPAPAAPPVRDEVSEYITDHVAPPQMRVASQVAMSLARPASPAASKRPPAPAPVAAPAAEEELDAEELLAGMEDEDDEDEDGEDGDADDEAEEVFFNLASAAAEDPGALGWSELVTWLASYDVEEPRLALLCLLLKDGNTELTGERVTAALKEMGLEELVEDAAAEVAENQAGGGASSALDPEERELVRRKASELRAQGERELASSKARGEAPRKASELKRSVEPEGSAEA